MLARKLRESFLLIFRHEETLKFSLTVVVGLAFSLAVILCTIGLMDGFVSTLKVGLRKSNGDITMTHHQGFFQLDNELKEEFETIGINHYAEIVQTESFLMVETDDDLKKQAKGVLLRGIDQNDFSVVTGLQLKFSDKEIAIGSELAKMLDVKVGDNVILTIAKGNNEVQSLPQLVSKKIGQIVTHGIYQKDLRLVYLGLADLQELLGVQKKINQVLFNTPGDNKETDHVASYLPLLKNQFSENFLFRPYWREFGSLIEAVQVEKVLIGMILQIVVVISIFNILAFIFYVNEKRARDFFLISALGLPRTDLMKIWFGAVFLLWLGGAFLSFFFVQLFKFLILKLSIINLPPEIYFLGAFDIQVGFLDYALVLFVALIWILFFSWLVIRKMKKRSLLEGLRQEFS